MEPQASAQAEADRLKREAAAHFEAGRTEDARVRYSEALRLSPQDLDARTGVINCTVRLGREALARNDPARAISHFQLALEFGPYHPEADDGLRQAAKMEQEKAGRDPFGEALESLGPVKALREIQTADRVVGKMAGTAPPSQVIKRTLDARREDLAQGGAPPRDKRIEHEMAAAWRRRWFYRSLPVVAVAGAIVLYALTGAPAVLNWGALLGLFAGLWDYVFVERGSVAAARLARP